jgi:hypothetical protein
VRSGSPISTGPPNANDRAAKSVAVRPWLRKPLRRLAHQAAVVRVAGLLSQHGIEVDNLEQSASVTLDDVLDAAAAFHRVSVFHTALGANSAASSADFVALSTCDEQGVGRILCFMAAVDNHPDVDRLRDRIGELVRERQELRTLGADRESLERNRIQLVRRQSELGRALIHRYTA